MVLEDISVKYTYHGFQPHVVAGVTVVRKYDEQSAVPCRVGKAEAWMAEYQLEYGKEIGVEVSYLSNNCLHYRPSSTL